MRRIYTPDAFKIPTGNGWDFDLQQFTGSGAGLNAVTKILGRCAAATSATYDSAIMYGPLMWEGAYFSKTSFQLLAQDGTTDPLSGWSVLFYGTHDYRALLMNQSPRIEVTEGFVLPDTSWAEIPAPSPEGSTPVWYNPMTDFGQVLFSPEPWIAVRFVATATSATGDIAITCTRIP